MSYRGSWDEKILKGDKTQYTRLKDYNDKEIYEGDIVLVHEKYPWVFEVRYCEEELGYGMYIDSIREGNLNEFVDSNTRIEIIGNIYEN